MKTITVKMNRPNWDAQLVTHRVLADVEEPCGVTQINDVTFEIECEQTREVREALNAHPAVKSYEVATAKQHHAVERMSRPKKTWHIFETGRATGDRWVAGPYMTKDRAEDLARRYMTDPPGPDSLRRSGVYIVKDHGP